VTWSTLGMRLRTLEMCLRTRLPGPPSGPPSPNSKSFSKYSPSASPSASQALSRRVPHPKRALGVRLGILQVVSKCPQATLRFPDVNSLKSALVIPELYAAKCPRAGGLRHCQVEMPKFGSVQFGAAFSRTANQTSVRFGL
jgi:hypothetical protein